MPGTNQAQHAINSALRRSPCFAELIDETPLAHTFFHMDIVQAPFVHCRWPHSWLLKLLLLHDKLVQWVGGSSLYDLGGR